MDMNVVVDDGGEEKETTSATTRTTPTFCLRCQIHTATRTRLFHVIAFPFHEFLFAISSFILQLITASVWRRNTGDE